MPKNPECDFCKEVSGVCTECDGCFGEHCQCDPCAHGKNRAEDCVFCGREYVIGFDLAVSNAER